MRTATVYNFLLEANLMASVAILLMLAVRKCLRRQLGNRALAFAWLLVAIRLLCPLALPNPAINQIRSSFAWDEAIRPIAGQIKVRVADAGEALSRAVSQWSGDSSGALTDALDRVVSANYNGLLSFRLMQVYLAGAMLVLCWFVFANLRFRRKLRADRIEPISGKLLEEYRLLCQQRGVKPVPVYFTDPLPSACLVGAFRPYIALPLTSRPQETIRVLRHEISHLQGKDHLWALLRLACCVVHWFNPLVWLAADMSRTDSELACDDRAVEGLNTEEKRAYANVLVLAAAKRNAPGVAVLATGMTMTGRRLKTRVSAILRNGQVKKSLALGFALLASMALVAAFATDEYRVLPNVPVLAQTQPAPLAAISSQEEAIAFAKTLWQSPYLNEDTSGAAWEVLHAADDCYQVTASREDWMGTLTVWVLPSGRVTHLYNRNCGYNRALAVEPLYDQGNDDKWDQLHAYAQGFLESWDGATAARLSDFRGMGEADYSNGNQRFTDFSAAFGDNRYAANMAVQIIPEVRVVCYDLDDKDLWWPDEEGWGEADASPGAERELAASPEGLSSAAVQPTTLGMNPAGTQATAEEQAAIDHAQALWENPLLEWDTTQAVWKCELTNDGAYWVTASFPGRETSLTTHLDPGGHLWYLYNGYTQYSVATPTETTLDDEAQEQLAIRLLAFVDSVNPGSADRIEAMRFVEENAAEEQRFVTFHGFDMGQKTYTLMILQTTPQLRVVCYSEGIPMDDGQA